MICIVFFPHDIGGMNGLQSMMRQFQQGAGGGMGGGMGGLGNMMGGGK